MRTVTTLGDYLSEAQLRTLVKDYQVEQKYGSDGQKRSIGGSRAPRRRQSELSGVDAVRARVQDYRHKRHAGKWKSHKPYLSQEDAIARYERRGERLESGDQMFAIGQGQSTRKHTDIRATAIKGGRPGHGGRISKRPTIGEDKSAAMRIVPERRGARSLTGYLA